MGKNKTVLNSDSATAKTLGLVSCHRCHLVSRRSSGKAVCARCGEPLHSRKPDSVGRTWALVIAAFILYIPANVLPITYTTSLGVEHADTIMSGVIYFMQSGSWPIGLIIFIASIFVPLVKLIILISLLLAVQFGWTWRPADLTRLYHLTEAVGRWSMLDIFVITILVALVNLGAIASISAGPGALFFALVVVITMFAAESFDPRLIWDNFEEMHEGKR